MSQRHLRRLEALKAEKEKPVLSQNVEDSEEDNDDVPIVPTIARNRFDLLLEGSGDGADADSDDHPNTANTISCEIIGDAEAREEVVKPKTKKKKKKRKKNKQVKVETADASEEQLDEVEATVREVNALLGEATLVEINGGGGFPVPSGRSHLLSIDYRFVDASVELQRMFGSDVVVVGGTGARGRAAPPQGGRSRASLTGGVKARTTRYDGGLSMAVDTDHPANGCDGRTVHRYEYDQKYMSHQRELTLALHSHDQGAVLQLLHTRPHHVATLLQLAGLFRGQGDTSYADDLVQNALLVLEAAMTGCRLSDATSSCFDYRREENRGLFLAIFHQMLAVARRRCFRSALELCKVLLRLSADDDDPLAALLLVDYYALRAREYVWLLEFYRTYDTKKTLCMMPNMAYSVPLACFYLSSGVGAGGGSMVGHRALRQLLQEAEVREGYRDKTALRNRADFSLQRALITFPEVFRILMEANGVKPEESVAACRHFYGGVSSTPLDAMFHLYSTRLAVLWKEPEVLAWLHANSVAVAERAKPTNMEFAYAEGGRRAAFGTGASLPVPVQRHLVLVEYPLLEQYLSPATLHAAQWRHHDVLPPFNSIGGVDPIFLRTSDSPADPTSPTRGILADFLATLLPDGFVPDASAVAGHEGGARAVEGGGARAAAAGGGQTVAPAPNRGAAAAGTASVPSFRFFLETARALLDSTLLLRRGDEEGGALHDRGDTDDDDEDTGGRDDDFNEDQEQI